MIVNVIRFRDKAVLQSKTLPNDLHYERVGEAERKLIPASCYIEITSDIGKLHWLGVGTMEGMECLSE